MGGGSVQAPQPTAEELAIQRQQLELMQKSAAQQEALEPFILQSLRLAPTEDGGLRRMTEEEFVATLSPTDRAAHENLQLAQERERKALLGELPLTEAGQQRKAEEFRIFKEQMARQGHQIEGDTPETATALSTPGIQALKAFQQRFGLLEEAERRGELDAGSLAVLQRMGVASDIGSQQRAGLLDFPMSPARLSQGFAGMLQPMQQQRAFEFQSNIERQRARTGLLQGAGQLAGTALGVGGTLAILSAREHKKDIKKQAPKDEKKALEMVKNMDTYSYRYKWEKDKGPKRMGLMADTAPDAIVTPDRQGLDVGRTVGLLVVAAKELARQVNARRLP